MIYDYQYGGNRKHNEDGSHQCETRGCDVLVQYDDEPYCFRCSPDSGSHLIGYSYRKDTFKKSATYHM